MENKKYLTLEEAENIVDNMYQKRWKECGIEEGNTIHMGNLDKLEYNELERASILLLRTEIRLKSENKKLKKQQEEFKEWLDNKSKEKIRDAGYHEKICIEILEKYNEITRIDE